MTGILTDCRHALRLYVRTPGASAIAVAVLAIGMAFVGAFLSLYVDLVLRPHPGFEQSRQISSIGQDSGSDLIGIAFGNIEILADEMTTIEAIAVRSGTPTFVGLDREPVIAGLVSEEFFPGLRPRLALGSGFSIEDHAPDAEPVVVLSYSYWQRRFGGDRGVIGSFVDIARDPIVPYRGPGVFTSAEPEQESARFRIVGVVESGVSRFDEYTQYEPALWVPLERAWPLFVGVPESLRTSRAATYVRRAEGVPVEAVVNELRARYEDSATITNLIPGAGLDAADGIVSNLAVHRDAKHQLELFLAGSVLLALVAAANVSLFLLARAPARRNELGVRLAVGAPMRRLARQLATEAGLLVLVSAALGLLGSVWLTLYLRGLAFLREAQWREVTLLDWRVMTLSGAIVLVLALLASLAPILGIRRLGIAAAAKQVTAGASLPQRSAGTLQFAAAGALGGAALAFAWYLAVLMFGDPGFETKDRYFVQISTQARGITQDEYTVAAARLSEAVEAIPGISAVAFGSPVPGSESEGRFPTMIPSPVDPTQQIGIQVGEIEQRFIELLGLNLIYGRAPEGQEPRVVVVNQTLARTIWGREDVVGEILSGSALLGNIRTGEGSQIVGVLEDVSFGHPSAPAKPYAFRGYANFLSGVIETRLTAAELQQALQDIESVLDVQVPVVRPLRDMRRELIAADRARSYLTMATAALVVLLSVFGFYGTLRYLVAAGRREYAIRAALGAGPRALGRLVVWRGLLLGLPGLAIGGLLSLIAVAWLRDDFGSIEVPATAVTLAVVVGLIAILLLASLGPAREARRTQPAPLLREQ